MFEFYLYKRRMKKKGYNIHKVNKTVIEYYKMITKNHKNLSDMEVIKRLNRNLTIGRCQSINELYLTVIYGALSITLNKKTDTIIGISNGVYNRKNIDKSLKEKLTKIFEIR